MRSIGTGAAIGALKDKTGSVGPIFGLFAMPMFFAIGLSIDYGRVLGLESELQNTLDGAALAAMRSSSGNPEMVGQAYFSENFDRWMGDSTTVHFTRLEDGTVRATASVSMPSTVAALMGINTFQVETFSVVEPSHQVSSSETTTVTDTGIIPCLHVMDQSGAYTLDLNGNTNLDARQCTVNVRSNSSSAVRATNSNNVKFRKIRVKGSGSTDSGTTAEASSSTITSDADITGNPYYDAIRDVVQAISIGNCTNANTNKTWSGTVSPGTYCGTTEFSDATFEPGLYIIKSGSGNKTGNLKFSGDIDGSAGVTFYLADNRSVLSSYDVNDGSVLTAPTTGTTRGLLIFEDSNRGATWDVDLSPPTTSTWEGVVYLPSANLTMSIEDWELFHVSMAVNQLYLSSWQDIEWIPYAWTPFNATDPITLEEEITTTTSTTAATDIYLRE